MRTGDTAKELIEAELEARGISVRGLAREIAGSPDGVERVRRNLNRILGGGDPKEETAAEIDRKSVV